MSGPTPSSRTLALTPVGQPDGFRRRAVLQALLGGVAGSFAWSTGASAQHPILAHLEHDDTVAQAQARATATDYQPAFLDSHQLRTLASLAEAIVPGSTAALVSPFLDQLLAVESSEHQREFLGALGAFDMAAIERHGRPWVQLGQEDQTRLLEHASTADPAKVPLRRHFQNLKDWVAGAYYSSEPGMRELGWTGGVVHPELPGCTHAGGHASS